MITKSTLDTVLQSMGFESDFPSIRKKSYPNLGDFTITIDFQAERIQYPEGEHGITVNDRTTCNFDHPENFVVLECVNRLLDKGYRPEHIELERRWNLGHEAKGGKADICVLDEGGKDMLFIIECKTPGSEYKKEHNNTELDGGQLFSYWQQEGATKWLVLYASTFNKETGSIEYETDAINCSDDKNILELAKKDNTIQIYKNAHTAKELFDVWNETYEKRFSGDVIFRDDSKAYAIGVKPLRKQDLKDFSENDRIVNSFEEILRHNNVSDKENAFNRLIALFICKLVDEIQKSDTDEVDFQYKVGTDTYETLQDRLQRLHTEGMEKFMREEIFYIPDSYAEDLVRQYTGQRRTKMIADLKKTIRILKFYTNNDFAFKDVHNEELFYQNGKILVEVIQLFENYRIIGSHDVQALGDLFEQLLNKGFKQNEGQFFTPVPITRFIWNALPLKKVMVKPGDEEGFEYPRIIDYACGAGHFLSEGFEAIMAHVPNAELRNLKANDWTKDKLYGIEKDYRLARVSKIALFMHGTGDGNIIFGDGLENYPEKGVEPNSFDILVANPPYSVAAFKPHLKLKNNSFVVLPYISNTGSEIETLFVERISQLVKPDGIASVILPSSILNKENGSFIKARESLLENFKIHSIVQLGSKTFGATGTNTIVLFLEKYHEPPKRRDMVEDSVQAILEIRDLNGWEDNEILQAYLEKIEVSPEEYCSFLTQQRTFEEWSGHFYFGMYVESFTQSSTYTKKTKQQLFRRKTDEERSKELNNLFYEDAIQREREKLLFFGLVYAQSTLIITAPDENKAQETFLGYKWSNRKGQEGIQIISPGGKLYNADNRDDENTLAGMIRSSFSDIQRDVPTLESCYYYLRTQDMLDFSSVNFNKAIKTTKKRPIRHENGMIPYRLSDRSLFEILIGDRVLADEMSENGQYPVYSANVFEPFGRIDKQNLKDFSLPSVIWGIDGDWMVNCLPANEPFYPTDHCGVLRIKSEAILPEYMAIALQVEGKYERFSRSNRASTQRIRALTIPVPEKQIQQNIISEIKAIDEKIKQEDMEVEELTENVKSKFVEMFGDITTSELTNGQQLGKICDTLSGGTPDTKNAYYYQGNIPWITTVSLGDDCVDERQAISFITEQAIEESATHLIPANTLLVGIRVGVGKSSITRTALCTNQDIVALIGIDSNQYNLRFLKYVLDAYQPYFNSIKKGMTIKGITSDDLKRIIVPNVNIDAQNRFDDYVRSIDKLKFEAKERRSKLKQERDSAIKKYFD